MFGTQDLLLFVVTGLVLNATPGVDMAYTVTRTLQHGWRGGISAALGISAGCIVHTLAAAVGLAALLATSTWAFQAIKWAGALYLLWLAWNMARSAIRPRTPPRTRPDAGAQPGTADLRRIFVQGFLTNVLNPKVALFFMALLPQFISAEAANKPLAFLFLGAVFIFNGTLFLLGLVALAQRLRRVGASPTVQRVLSALGATLFGALAARLALAER
jgi:threonine/homoserine/homoserine lactone efflux protein